MTIHIDAWLTAKSAPIPVPPVKPRQGSTVEIGTPSHTYPVYINNVSKELVVGTLLSTPPEEKPYRKADMVLFHMDNVMSVCGPPGGTHAAPIKMR